MKSKLTVVLLLGFITLSSCQEKKLVLSEGEVSDELHKANIGKITFMQDVVPYEEYEEKDFLTNVTITEGKNFNIRMFLGKTLSYYLSELAPNLTANELCAKGNFQISFIVDNQLVHVDNLNVNAGSADYKNSATVYRVPLMSNQEEDHWGRFLWMRFMLQNGGEDLLTEGEHNLKIEVRPYIELEKIKVGKIIAEGQVTLDVVEEEIEVPENKIAIQEIQPNSGWVLSGGDYDKDKIRELNKKIAQKKFKDITGIVVIKNGELMLEEYFNETARDTRHNTRSVGKSFMSAVMGLAIADGHIKDENQKLKDFYNLNQFKNFSKGKEQVTIKRLLTMTSGFQGDDSDYDNPGNEEYMYDKPDWVKFALDQPMDAEETLGKNWKYFTAGSVVLGDVIHQSVPGGLEKYAEEHFFEPLGITDYQWQYTPKKVANTAGGIQMNVLDFAKFGQLYKNGGAWNGQQILRKEWVEKSLAKQVALPADRDGYYGYQFWNKTFEIKGKSYEVSYCTGTGGNKIYIFKNAPLVIVITSKAYRLPQAHSQVKKMMENYILPAMID